MVISPGWVGVSAKSWETLAETWPLKTLKLLAVPPEVICKLGRFGGAGIALGWPPSNLRVKVALSPTLTVSRSSVAVKVAANSAGAKHIERTKLITKLSPGRDCKRDVRIWVFSAVCCAR